MTKRRARWKISSSLQLGFFCFTRWANLLCQRRKRMANDSKAGFWFVRGSPRTVAKQVGWLAKRRERMSKATLTIQSLGAEGSHDVWHGIVEEWNPHRVLHRHLAAFISQQRTVLKRSHGVEPGLRRAVNQTAIDPRRHLVNLSRGVGVSRQFLASASQFTCSRGAFGLCPVFLSYIARWNGMYLSPRHSLSYISSHFSMSIRCISMGHPDSDAMTISFVTTCPKKASKAVRFSFELRPSWPRMNSRLSFRGDGRFGPAMP